MRNKKNIRTRNKYNTTLGEIAVSRPHSNSSTGVKGVYRVWNSDYYQARISINKQEIILINTKDFNEAVRVRKEAEEEYYKSIIDEAIKNGDFIS